MTLREWCKQANVLPTHPTTEKQAVSLLADHNTPNYHELWNLEDYNVSSRSGPVFWLTPKPQPAEENTCPCCGFVSP